MPRTPSSAKHACVLALLLGLWLVWSGMAPPRSQALAIGAREGAVAVLARATTHADRPSLEARVRADGVELTWKAPAGTRMAGKYRVFRDGRRIAETWGRQYTDRSQTRGRVHTYYVAAYTALGRRIAASAAVRVASARDIRTGPIPTLTAKAGDRVVWLAWTATGGSYRVYRNGAPIGRTNSTVFGDYRVVDGRRYSYAVAAYGRSGRLMSTSSEQTATPTPTPAVAPMFWGAWIKNSAGEAPWSSTALDIFERNAGRAVSLINWSSPFYSTKYCDGYCRFWPNDFQTVRDHGAVPFFSWNPGPGNGGFTPAAIASGAQDGYITSWAQAAKEWGHPFFLRFAWEMNGNWFPWGVGANRTTPAIYVAMWRHVHDIFTRVGATNVTWVWCPNADPWGEYASLASVYPGDAYVDWTCVDGYNGNAPYLSFEDIFASAYDTITTTVAPTKPMLVGETGTTESGGKKAQWIADMFAALPTKFPRIRGLLWFDKVDRGPGGHSDWPIETSAASVAAFAKGIASPQFQANRFGAISGWPISPPA